MTADICFDLHYRLPTLNQVMRMHWHKRRRETQTLAWLVEQACPRHRRPQRPIFRARVEVVRYSPQQPDPDGLRACAKMLLDVLQPRSKRHPYGLAFIFEDDAEHLELDVRHFTHCDKLTRVLIRDRG